MDEVKVKPSKGAPQQHSGGRRAAAAFDFEADEELGPELRITDVPKKLASPVTAEEGADLSDKKKIVLFVGRGKTGKTTTIRWVTERAIASGRPLLLADMDPTNGTFSQYFSDVHRPSDPADPAHSLKWFDKLLQHTLKVGASLVVDLGGGDTTLRRLVGQLPDVVSAFEELGFAVVILYTVGPQEEDLSPLATMTNLGFRPTATAILLNEAMAEVGEPREAAFARVFAHSTFESACDGGGAIPIWLPKLFAAQEVETRRISFRDAADGQAGLMKTPLGPFDRLRVKLWLKTMDENFAGIKTWLP